MAAEHMERFFGGFGFDYDPAGGDTIDMKQFEEARARDPEAFRGAKGSGKRGKGQRIWFFVLVLFRLLAWT